MNIRLLGVLLPIILVPAICWGQHAIDLGNTSTYVVDDSNHGFNFPIRQGTGLEVRLIGGDLDDEFYEPGGGRIQLDESNNVFINIDRQSNIVSLLGRTPTINGINPDVKRAIAEIKTKNKTITRVFLGNSG